MTRPATFAHSLILPLLAGAFSVACSSSETAAPSGTGGGTGSSTSTGSTGTTSSTGSTGTTGTGTTGTGGGNPDAVVGGFTVSLVAAVAETMTPAFTSVIGKVYDGANPSAIIWTTTDQANGCDLKTPRVPFCSPGCGGSAVCADDSTCVPYPTGKDVGKVHAKGLGSAEFDMELIGGNYQSGELPNPPCPEGAEILLQTGGGAYAPFTLTSQCIVPLAVSGTGALPIQSGAALNLEWTKAPNADIARIEIALDISHHGGQKGEIDCDVADTGSFDIPANLMTKLVMLGFAGFPTIRLTRVASASTAIQPGRVSLKVVSTVEREIQIPGLVSCNETTDCPSGQTCQTNRTCK